MSGALFHNLLTDFPFFSVMIGVGLKTIILAVSQFGQRHFGHYTFGRETFETKKFWSMAFRPEMFWPK